MSDEPRRHTVTASRVEMTEIVLPEDTNSWGHIFGGRVLALVDKCAAVVAIRHCRSGVLTASIDRVDFLAPVHLGEVMVLRGRLNATFRTSLEVGVEVFSEKPLSGERTLTCQALVTLVGVDREGKPVPVPPIVPETDEDRSLVQAAAERRRLRLASRRD
jgi:acyl-CoA hydrolase